MKKTFRWWWKVCRIIEFLSKWLSWVVLIHVQEREPSVGTGHLLVYIILFFKYVILFVLHTFNEHLETRQEQECPWSVLLILLHKGWQLVNYNSLTSYYWLAL